MTKTNEQLKSNVQSFWEDNPLASAAIPFEPGSPEFFFEEHTRLRRIEHSLEMDQWAYETSRVSGKNLLDIGCGNGYLTCLYAGAGAGVSAIDLTEKAVELTKS